MDDILDEIGLGDVKEIFRRNRLQPEDIKSLTEKEFEDLGVNTIGDRARLRERCRDKCEADDSPCLMRVRHFQTQRKGKGKRGLQYNVNRQEKSTRRILFGWKHMSKKSYQLITANKGGGSVVLDVPKQSLIDSLKEQVTEHFFPGGENKIQGLKTEHLILFLATFTGEEVEGNLVDDILKNLKSSPVRLYLHSRQKDENTVPVSKTEGGESSETADQDADEVQFVDAETPTIQFRNRNRERLSLRPRNTTETGATTSTLEATAGPSMINSDHTDWLEVMDSEDEEMARAIEESLRESREYNPAQNTLTLVEVLKGCQVEVPSLSRCDVIVSRKNVLGTAFNAFRRSSFEIKSNLYVKFSGERGVDHGGPRREFFRLAIRELQNSNLFEGPEEGRFFSHNVHLLEKEEYKLAGKLAALSLCNDGPGLRFLNEKLYDLMTGKKGDFEDCNSSLNLLPADIKEVIQKLLSMDSEESRDSFLNDHGDWLIDQGIVDITKVTICNRENIAAMVTKYYLYYRTGAEIAQFKEGVNELNNMWDLIQMYSHLFKQLFCYPAVPLKKEDFDEMMEPTYSEPGSNMRSKEDDTMYSWELFLQDIQDGSLPLTFGELMSFITGADHIPPCGFCQKVLISFYDQTDGTTRYPSVSTCAFYLWLPRGMDNAKDFAELMVDAVKNSLGFLKI
ncbi:G2/M phase-specific E3 ubiquitin-protein ligase-like [Mercenaria mercenaria]|uniref:G2/M phase-specific E3 ubiquitin-protein ligase-like n=1 Tax=Mercenaria mercenaria TaxID=6596 RepID=UPI00234F0D5A|nr:G2/M phase-specific E3 ubiquitin-protein ligase-like [Mercenaria mercenaria]